MRADDVKQAHAAREHQRLPAAGAAAASRSLRTVDNMDAAASCQQEAAVPAPSALGQRGCDCRLCCRNGLTQLLQKRALFGERRCCTA